VLQSSQADALITLLSFRGNRPAQGKNVRVLYEIWKLLRGAVLSFIADENLSRGAAIRIQSRPFSVRFRVVNRALSARKLMTELQET
jgi:hypothetical protein